MGSTFSTHWYQGSNVQHHGSSTSRLLVCCTIWRTTSDTNLGKVQKIQNCGMRIILQCHPRTHIADMLLNLKWLSIKQRIMFLTTVLVFKIVHFKTQNYMSHWLVPVSHQYGTRRSTSPRSHQITPKFAHYQRHSTLESVTNIHSNSPKPQDIKKNTASFLHCT